MVAFKIYSSLLLQCVCVCVCLEIYLFEDTVVLESKMHVFLQLKNTESLV